MQQVVAIDTSQRPIKSSHNLKYTDAEAATKPLTEGALD
jgi:hypothetical protein